MSQEKYSGYYVELLTSTLQDQILQNISLKAKEKVNGEIFEEVTKGYQDVLAENETLKTDKEQSLSQKEVSKNAEIESLRKQLADVQSSKNTEIENLKKRNIEQLQQAQTNKNNETDSLNKKIVDLQNTITGLQSEINKSNQVRLEYDKVKQQLAHMDTFRNQLIELQKVVTEKDSIITDKDVTIEDLNQQILTLQSTPTKRKKASGSKLETVTTEDTLETVDATRDGGIF
jgi:DNA repair exonuclease SbcCD ATPase subunit